MRAGACDWLGNAGKKIPRVHSQTITTQTCRSLPLSSCKLCVEQPHSLSPTSEYNNNKTKNDEFVEILSYALLRQLRGSSIDHYQAFLYSLVG